MNAARKWERLYRLLTNRDWPEALKAIDEIIDEEPENANHYLKKGDICMKAGDKAGSLNAYLRAAWYLNNQGFLRKSLAVYKMALRLDPDNDEANRAANRIMMEIESSARTSTKEWTGVFEPGQPSGEAETFEMEAEEQAVLLQPVASQDEVSSGGTVSEETEDPRAGLRGPSPQGFLSHFTGSEIEEILSRSELRNFADGETVVREGDTGDSIYVIKSGSASVVGHFFGRVVHLENLSEGDIFGEVAFLTGRTRTANVISKGGLEAYELDRLLLEELVERRPEILSQINEIYIKRVKDTIRKVKSKDS